MEDTRTYALIACLKILGKIDCVRVSSAQSGTRYNYYGVVRYECRLNRKGTPSLYALYRATSDRRSITLALEDADDAAFRERRVHFRGSSRKVGPTRTEMLLNHVWHVPEVAHIIAVLEMQHEVP